MIAPVLRDDAPRSRARDRSASVRPREPEVPAADRETELDTRDRQTFAAAHALHFEGADPRLALRAWERYLAEFPAGRFVPEAEWNRALCLLRVGERERVIEALTPFAEGAHGGVRQREAHALLDALESH
ncbi:Hypothetical protein I5071_170 (plasmid) [Sandaracinus amylolyticus]|nr:Hypothetical protein MSR10575_88270 [Sandaracinus sp.]UJR87226.1 Hypothetical protein I5071_170 [Sandaracinus amylolyticus]